MWPIPQPQKQTLRLFGEVGILSGVSSGRDSSDHRPDNGIATHHDHDLKEDEMVKMTNHTFVYAHLMRWEPLQLEGGEGPCWIKTLAKDEETGAKTVLLRFGPGYRQKETVSTVYADMYVLEGEMQSGERFYGKDAYHYRPPGSRIGPISCVEGITRLMFTGGPKDKFSTQELFVPDIKELPWQKDYVNLDHSTSMIKVLRQDKESDVSVLIHGHWQVGGRVLPGQGHIHDHVEEAYVIMGENEDFLEDIDGHIYWVPGTYLCRQPGTSMHGDTLKHSVPFHTFIRRCFVDQMVEFHQPNPLNIVSDVPPISFSE